eukprot:c44818_g1_i1 orf=42-227(+)
MSAHSESSLPASTPREFQEGGCGFETPRGCHLRSLDSPQCSLVLREAHHSSLRAEYLGCSR